MRITLMRHGIAALRGDPSWPRDADRPLTGRGRKRTRAVALGMGRLGLRPDRVWTSPFARAAQTAAIVAEALGMEPDQVRQEPLLEPGGSAADLLAGALASGLEHLLLVGHEPDLSQLAAFLLTGHADGLRIALKKAAVCSIALEEAPAAGSGELVLLWQPTSLRALGGDGD